MEKRKIRQVHNKEVFRLYISEEEENKDFKWYISKASNHNNEEKIIACFVEEKDARNCYDILTGRSIIVNESQFMDLYKQLKRPRRNPHKED